MSRQQRRQLDNDFIVFYTNANYFSNKVTELSVLASVKKFKIMCVTETHFNDEIKDAEISIPNYIVHREDRSRDTNGGGSAIYTHNSLSVEKLDWFKGSESIAIKVNLDSTELYIVCLYRSTSLVTLEENEKLLYQIANIPTSPDINLVVIGDLNLPDIDWELGIVKKPVNSTDRRYILQSEYLDLFLAKGLKWHITDEVTRMRKVNNTIQKSTLDQPWNDPNKMAPNPIVLNKMAYFSIVFYHTAGNFFWNSLFIVKL